MIEMIREIMKYRDLLWMLTLRDIRIRYKQAAMGFLWAIFMPIIAVAAGVLIKKAMSVVSGKPMDLEGILSISVKVLPWTFFISAIKFSVQSLVGNRNLITKIYFPKAVLVFASIFACLFDFMIASSVLFLLLLMMGVGFHVYLFWLPILLISLVFFTSGLGLLLSSANLFYRDIKYIVEIILMFGIFFTPVFYEASAFGEWKTLLLLNPLGSILEAINAVIVLHLMPEINWIVYSVVSSVLVFFAGLAVFHKYEPIFAEYI